jgi:hypothetical protein
MKKKINFNFNNYVFRFLMCNIRIIKYCKLKVNYFKKKKKYLDLFNQ